MSIKRDIVRNVRIFWAILAFFALLIVGRIVQLQMTPVSEIGAVAVEVYTTKKKFAAPRGEIYAKNGYLLACSLTFFDLRMDLGAEAITDSIFSANVDSLALCLARLFKDKNQNAYLRELKSARRNNERYHYLGNRKINYMEAEKVKRFPILRRGKYKGGLILEQEILRHRPFGMLGERTLGKLETNAKGVKVGALGLEHAYESELKGVEGVREWRIAPRNRMDFIVKEAVEGNDIITTIDVDMQDLAESALMEQLEQFKAHHGTVTVMEVSTGEIKAIANLEIASDGNYYERRNHAIADAVEPGSVFKLPSMIALLEDGVVKLTDSINTGNGARRFYGATMRDYHAVGKITVQEVFEKSSNVGTSMLVHAAYKDNPQRYIDRLYDLHLGEPLNLKIKGEGRPYIKDTKSSAWWSTSLPWMSVGYEVNVTPLHMLTLYNAIANNGKMVKPRLVYAIKRNGKMIRDFSKPIVIDNNICSEETVKKLHIMLEGVVERGTARNIRDSRYKIAGKTGTAHIAKVGGGYDNQNYRATFIGYFPADNPKYSCAVVIDKPDRSIGRFGGSVAGPVFKKISDALYAKGMLTEKKPLESVLDSTRHRLMLLPGINESTALGKVIGEEFLQENSPIKNSESLMPNVVGMTLTDAVFLLESKGLKVKVQGSGLITNQSLKPGTKIVKGTQVNIYLS
ncbi:cell division protein FtsI (penicillin-binding protein 3) [Balneicella halophila]|uniref:Cell division protein FtsI (Penicillin-binding protein 3) n=1 Tax=Balneicella halophila TaxID=1537566 RepID=A0A7L4UP98_BALHA|nr:penicillin-binding protein [Balneicella halophila]PVX50938.1 cell division protein FtsI (penicillin-binding protein 3) [Balneicella halophila]